MKRHFKVSRSELIHLIDEWIFSERDRYIAKRILCDDLTYEEVAIELDDMGKYLSIRQLKNIMRDVILILKEKDAF